VTLEDEVGDGLPNNLVQIPVTAIILDENDNAPVFKDVSIFLSLIRNACAYCMCQLWWEHVLFYSKIRNAIAVTVLAHKATLKVRQFLIYCAFLSYS
jgi:hypothetical protein